MIDLQEPTDSADADLRALMSRAVAHLDAPVDRLYPGAVARGHQLRRRRQGLTALSGLAAAVAVTALVVPAVSGDDSSPNGPGFAGDPSPTQPEATLTRDPGGTEHGFWEMKSEEMLARVRPVLPADVRITGSQLVVTDPAPGQSDVGRGWLRVELARDGIAGSGTLEIILWGAVGDTRGTVEVGTATGEGDPAPQLGDDQSEGGSAIATAVPVEEDLTRCPEDAGSRDGTCSQLEDSDGNPVGTAWSTSYGGLTIRDLTLAVAEGYVYVATANSLDAKWGSESTTSADQPPLAKSELRAIAESPTWTD